MNTISHFIHQLSYPQLPNAVRSQAKVCLLDLLGVAVAGHKTRLSKIMESFVTDQYPGNVPLLFSDKRASATGATLFGAMLIDSIDAHDGQVLTKGHVGVAILPALLALAEQEKLNGEEFLTALVVGYEIATRAGIALHATAADYHTSGAWNGIAVAAVASRILKLDQQQTLEALGTAEFYGPRSQMMRCIDHPTMVKDGSGWGALAGISAALLARSGFTGAPAVSLFGDDVTQIWEDLGSRWYIMDQYFKAYPVCRWAQPAVESVRQLRDQMPADLSQIESIEIHTFHEGTRLHVRQPDTTEQAQYSLPFSVASALIDDVVTAEAIAENERGLHHPLRQQLSHKVICHEVDRYNALFPAERWAHAVIRLQNGQCFESAPTIARGNPENPLSQQELEGKFLTLAAGLEQSTATKIIQQIMGIQAMNPADLKQFFSLLHTPV